MNDIGFNMNLSNFALIIAVIFISVIALNVFVSFPLISATTSSISSSPSQTESSLLWTTGANMPTKRSEVVGVALGEKIYVIAGLLTGHSDSPTNIVEVYDTKTDKWSTAAPLPEPLHHIAAAAYNGKVYVVGGWDAEKNSSNKLFIYDPDANRWQEGKPMPTARGGLTAKFVNGILYAIGGREYEENFFTTNEAYNPQTNTWTEKAPMPTARHHLSSAVVDDKIYVIGGRDKTSDLSDTFNVNEMYNTKQDTWTVLEPMPSKRAGLAAAVSADGNIYVFGGEKRGGVFDNNEKYDTKTNKWISEPPMPTARHGIAVEVVGDRIYIIGGGPEPGASVTNVNEIFRIITSGTQ